MRRFTAETMTEIIHTLASALADHRRPWVEFEVQLLPPDTDIYPGELTDTISGGVRYRTLQNLVDLADVLKCHLYPGEQNDDWMGFRLCPRPTLDGWHGAERDTEKYGISSPYQRIKKLEDPSVGYHLRRSLEEADIYRCRRLISLGMNTGDELEPVYQMNPEIYCAGIDHSASAIATAKRRWNGRQHEFITMDINEIERLDTDHYQSYDVFMSLGTLHSPGVDSKRVFMWGMQHLLAKGARVIIGFPNCRWINGHPAHGAKTRNRSETDMSLVIKDVYFIKKYLQQHRFNVTIFGKYYLFVVGTPF